MAELTDLDGVGPARSDSLAEAGYDSVEALADADPETLAEEADIPADRALDFVVQSQNLVEDSDDAEGSEDDAEESEEEDGPSPAELAEAAEESEEDASDDAEEEAAAEPEEETYALTVNLASDIHYDAYMTALFNAYERRYGSHQPSVDAINHVLDDARYNSGEVTHELTEYELNSMHSAVSQQVTDYKGQNMIDHMDAANDILAQVNEVREEELF